VRRLRVTRRVAVVQTRGTMDVSAALHERRSIRDFKPDPVPEPLLTAVLEDARWSPSWSNTQPYRVALAKGPARDALAAELCEQFDTGMAVRRGSALKKLVGLVTRKGMPTPDVAVPMKYPADLQPARRATGFGLYRLLGISRDDRAARNAQMRRNYEFFGAPVVAFVFVHRGLGMYAALDAGVFIQSLMLSAHARGLGTCAQAALAVWAAPVRERFKVPAHYRLLVGVAIGFVSAHPVNEYNPGRPPVEGLLLEPSHFEGDRTARRADRDQGAGEGGGATPPARMSSCRPSSP
jgi:nitroreductase